jgi:hypothetical protein
VKGKMVSISAYFTLLELVRLLGNSSIRQDDQSFEGQQEETERVVVDDVVIQVHQDGM